MTNTQRIIEQYLRSQFQGVRYELASENAVVVHDRNGESMTFTANAHYDIIDADTGKIIAVSNVDHSLTASIEEPTAWKNSIEYFG